MERRCQRTQIQTNQPSKIVGLAAAYETPTTIKDIDGRSFNELIKRGAFTRSLKEQPDIKCLRDHNPSLLLGRTPNTLRIWESEQGLHFECDLPDTDYARELVESIKRGDLDSCSFGFNIDKDVWSNKDNTPTRELQDVTLYEVSIVSFPAYSLGTSVSLRHALHKPNYRLLRAKIRLAENR